MAKPQGYCLSPLLRETDNNPPYIVILTGGIASGKTTVSELFQALGVPVIDTDIIARQQVEPGKPALREIKEKLGTEYLLPDGNLDRAKMRVAAFSDVKVRQNLEKILHPYIREAALKQISKLRCPYCILVVPLYVESSGYFKADCVLVVDVPEEIQIERLMHRDSVNLEFASAMLGAQAKREDRLRVADAVIKNDGDIDILKSQVRRLHLRFLELLNQRQLTSEPCNSAP